MFFIKQHRDVPLDLLLLSLTVCIADKIVPLVYDMERECGKSFARLKSHAPATGASKAASLR
jgi:hypothetical protein